MKLVNLNNQTYINIERIGEIVPWGEDTTRIFIGGSEGYHDISLPIKKVLDAICGSEEHSVEYEDDENYRQNKGLVNDANMNILKAESINSGHLNQQKYPSR
ncbi:hypothetical protein [Pediococcus acidilactici]|uniref:hypothetical protein n=1 Tax=Pediococcus acidilactici TaxID=1254 RepID=UPI003D7763F2